MVFYLLHKQVHTTAGISLCFMNLGFLEYFKKDTVYVGVTGAIAWLFRV